MPRLQPTPRILAPDPRLARALWQWLALGALLLVLFPAARGYSAAVGWLPFWLLVAPGVSLCVLYRHRLRDRLAAARSRFLVPGSRRRRLLRRGQARRVGAGQARRTPLRAA
ncbi:hypothetical protein [Rehaibacterium terrae]|jgi:hypothetical protein|uniref:Transmembrane protein n=1 Tax=Rehaibacterium terrae TaxID=1341696 RepID=A0A7W7XYJ3_9GAMM|nr:hypothetical protein [Rehaibacterium terrae]MBB5014784.1 hypothetical protein [Rehaibacterium terrae]